MSIQNNVSVASGFFIGNGNASKLSSFRSDFIAALQRSKNDPLKPLKVQPFNSAATRSLDEQVQNDLAGSRLS